MAIKLSSRTDREEKLHRELERIVTSLKKFDVRKIILFGSLAAGNIGTKSDIDLLVIKQTNERFLKRLEEFYEEFSPSFALDILCYTPDEIEAMSKWSSFIKGVLKKGRVLYEAG